MRSRSSWSPASSSSTWQAVRATSAEAGAPSVPSSRRTSSDSPPRWRNKQALEAKTEADTQRDEARLTAYASGMGLAQRAWDENNVVRARELLAEVPKEAAGRNLRGFEWFYLSRLCHPDERNLVGDPGRSTAWRSARTASVWLRGAVTRR